MRYFHDLYGSFQLTDHFQLYWGLILEQNRKMKGSEQYNIWYSPNVQMKYQLDNKWAVAGSVEYYSDKNGVIIATELLTDFRLSDIL
jgi:hypothetical protein